MPARSIRLAHGRSAHRHHPGPRHLSQPDGALLPGQFVRVEHDRHRHARRHRRPEGGDPQGPLGPFVYVVEPDNMAQARQVRLCRELADGWIVRKGLKDRRPHRRRRRDPRASGQARHAGRASPTATAAEGRQAVISSFFIDRPVFAVGHLDRDRAGGAGGDAGAADLAVSPDRAARGRRSPRPIRAPRPRRSPQTVAAPLEQQINGVERMLYMQSTSTGSGTMSLTVTFEIGTNPDQNAINVNNRVQRALPLLPGEVTPPGRGRAEALDLDPAGADHVVAGRALRHDLHQQLRAGERDRRAAPPARRRRRRAVRRLGLFDAHLAQARQARAVQPHAGRHRRRGARAERSSSPPAASARSR